MRGSSSPTYHSTHFQFLPSNFTGPLIFFSVLLLIGLSIPLISWLSSSSTSSNSSTFSSLSNDLVSSNSKNPPSRPNRPKVKKLNPTTNDLSGSYGLTDSKDFSLAFQLDGWKDLKSSLKVHQGQGIDENKVKSLLGPNGKLKRLSMDVTFNGTFGPKSSDLNWCAEGQFVISILLNCFFLFFDFSLLMPSFFLLSICHDLQIQTKGSSHIPITKEISFLKM